MSHFAPDAFQGDGRRRMLLLLCLLFTSLLSVFYVNGAFDHAHDALSDRLQIYFAPTPEERPVVYLLITDASLIEADELDGISWPWPRSAYGEALRFLKNAGAAEIAFDIIFSERSVHGVEDDIAFGEAVADSGAILATLSSSNRSSMSEKRAAANRELARPSALPVDGGKQAIFSDYPYLRTPVTELARQSKSLGDVKFVQESDGIGRRIPMLVKNGELYLPSLSLAVAAARLGIEAYAIEGRDLVLSGPNIERRIPLDREGMARPRYYGDSGIYDKYLLLRVIKSQISMDEGGDPYYDPALFKDKIVIIGADATELKDFRPNPFNKENDPGAHYHGSAIHNILAGDFLRSRYESGYVLPLIFASALLIALIAARFRAAKSFAVTFLLLLGIWATALYLFRYHGLLIDTAATSVNLIGCFVVATAYNYLIEARQRFFITSAFGQYLSPEVVTELANNPDRLKLGGEVRTMTAFFSDIAGFSSISEKLSPQELVALLNEYLTEMCDIIGRHQGTVDKFEGDAIMAFWGAPLQNDDHAALALTAALEMQEQLAELRAKWRDEGKPLLYARMGINSGPMLVGNMGSDNRMNYTIMGDAVNLASRLEGANKFYGTDLMLSRKTKKLAGDRFVTRELDAIQVVGKKKAVRVYELLGRQGDVEVERVAGARLFEEGLASYRQGDFATAARLFAEVQEHIEGDSPSATLLQRIEDMGGVPPEGDWDGVFYADSKG